MSTAAAPRIDFFASNPLARAKDAVRALVGLNRDPNRLDLVFVLGEAVNRSAFPRMWSLLATDADGQRILAERPAIDSTHVDLEALARLPDGTLGREYVRFLRDNHITPDVFKAPAGVDPRAAYLAQRIRQTHDLWHVLTGYEPDVRGEVLLQAFTYAQLGAPSSALIALLGTVRSTLRLGTQFLVDLRTAYRRGRQAKKLAAFYWEEHWSESVSSLRERLDCPLA